MLEVHNEEWDPNWRIHSTNITYIIISTGALWTS